MRIVAGALAVTALTVGLTVAVAQTNQNAQTGQQNRSDPKAGQRGPDGTVGAMQNTVDNKATSAQDVQRQTEGKPTVAQEAQQGDAASHPDITKHAPGTVGASPGNTPPSGREARK
jgi:hypothetical protein